MWKLTKKGGKLMVIECYIGIAIVLNLISIGLLVRHIARQKGKVNVT